MKILINALGANMGGAIRHLTNFLPQLGKVDSEREYVILVRDTIPEITVAKNLHIERLPDAQAGNWRKRLFGDVISLPMRLKKEGFSATVSLLNVGPIWSPVPHILFQRNALYFCDYFLEHISGRRKIETLLRRKLAIASMKRADVIVTPSNAMADMIRHSTGKLGDKNFLTLYHGFDVNTLNQRIDKAIVEKLQSIQGPKLLYPTHAALHKGFDVLFSALAKLRERGVTITLITTFSAEDWPEGVSRYKQQIKKLGLENNVVFLGRIPQDQMGPLYQNVDAMVYPSLCESFGFSMIEAMGNGLPIVAAATAVNKEICGGGAVYYSSLNPENAATVIKSVLDANIQKGLIKETEYRFQEFDWGWQRYTREFVSMIEDVV